MNTQDNVYFKQAHRLGSVQAYVPYAPTNGAPAGFTARPYGRPAPTAAADDAMLAISIVGLCLTFALGLPVGLFTGPAALKRAKRVEHLVNVGHRPMSDRSNVTGARICAWISIVLSVPLLLMWLGMFLIIAMAFAG
jgi:hypothetical protein